MKMTPAAKPLPVYMQIAELLARQIKAGYWHTGERLPTEAELAQRLSVAVGTLRKSLGLLESQGVLERIQGSGTYVRQTRGTAQIYELFRLELSDGPGLPTEALSQAGTAFFTTKTEGLGVGLSIAKSIAQQHGGSLSIGNCPSGGAVVELQLPVMD